MEFDWTTALLEVINFLVLVWLLKRFFYRPVLAVLEQRRADGEKILGDAEALRRDADALKAQYQARLGDAGRERDLALSRLDEEIAAERSRRLGVVAREIDAERQRREALAERESSEREAALQRQALDLAARFAGRVLERAAGPELEAKLIDLALEELAAQPSEQLATLSAALREPAVRISAVTAFPLDAGRRAALAASLGKLAGHPLEPAFSEDASLKSGILLLVGPWVLMANLRDELHFFAGALTHGG